MTKHASLLTILAAILAATPAVRADLEARNAALSLVPDRPQMVLLADLAALRGRPGLLRMKDRVSVFPGAWPAIHGLEASTGLDTDRHFDLMVVAGWPDSRTGHVSLVIAREAAGAPGARGPIDAGSVRENLARVGWRAGAKRDGPELYFSPERPAAGAKGTTTRRRACALPGDGWILWGDPEPVRAALARSAASRGGAARRSGRSGPASLRRVIGETAGRGHAWAVLAHEGLVRRALSRMVPESVEPVVDSVIRLQRLTLIVEAGEDVLLRGEGAASNARDAGAAADAIRAAVALSKLAIGGDDPVSLEALRTVRVEQDGSGVLVTGRVTDAVLSRLDETAAR